MFSFTGLTAPDEFYESFKKAILQIDMDSIAELTHQAAVLHYDLNINDPKTKYTLLHFAATKTTHDNENHMLVILDVLVNAGIDINQHTLDKSHFVPLHTAARRGLALTTKWLLDHGAERSIRDLKHGQPYQTALDYVQKSLTTSDSSSEAQSNLEEIANLLQNYFPRPKTSSGCIIL